MREPAPDSRKALKAVMDGLEVAGIKEEKDAPEVRCAVLRCAAVHSCLRRCPCTSWLCI